jgi:hypothetical protein
MTDQILPFGSAPYFIILGVLLFSRGMDFLSTWVATPNLMLEGNPLAKWMGWRGGLAFNVFFCVAVAMWPLPAIMVSSMSLLVAARNFQSAWVMRNMGETNYSLWMYEQLRSGPVWLFVLCIGGQSLLTSLIGVGLMLYSNERSIPFAIGAGIVGYGVAILMFSLLSIWRIRRA